MPANFRLVCLLLGIVTFSVADFGFAEDQVDGSKTLAPLLKESRLRYEEIDGFFGGRVKIFDSAEVVARKLKGILEKEHLMCSGSQAHNQFFVSDYTSAFEAATKIFFKKEIHLELCRL